MSKRKPKPKAPTPSLRAQQLDARKRRAHQHAEHVLLTRSWIAHLTTAAFLAERDTQTKRLDQHRKRCSDELCVALLLAREWSLDATGTGTTSGIADPTGNAAIAGHRNVHTGLVRLINDGLNVRSVREVIAAADRIDRCLDHLDITNNRNAPAFDRGTLHNENTARGSCARCGRWCAGTRSKTLEDGTRQPEDRLKRADTQWLCDTCCKAWQRRTDRQMTINEWIGEWT